MKLNIKKREDENLEEGIFDFFKKKKPEQATQTPSYADVAQKTRQKMQQKMQNKDYQDVVSQVSGRKKGVNPANQTQTPNFEFQMLSKLSGFVNQDPVNVLKTHNNDAIEGVKMFLKGVYNHIVNNQETQQGYQSENLPNYTFKDVQGGKRGIMDVAQELISSISQNPGNIPRKLEPGNVGTDEILYNVKNLPRDTKMNILTRTIRQMINSDIQRKKRQKQDLETNIPAQELAWKNKAELKKKEGKPAQFGRAWRGKTVTYGPGNETTLTPDQIQKSQNLRELKNVKLNIKKREDENLEEGIFDFFKKKKPEQATQTPSYADVAQKTRQKMQQKMQNKDYQDVVSQVSDRKKELDRRKELSGLEKSDQMKSENPQFYYNLLRQLGPVFGTNSPEQSEQKIKHVFQSLVQKVPYYDLNDPTLGGQTIRVPGYELKADPEFARISGTGRFMPPEQLQGGENFWLKRTIVDLAMEMIRASSILGKDLTPGKLSQNLEEQQNSNFLINLLQEVIKIDKQQKLEQAKKIQDVRTYKHVKTPPAFDQTGVVGEPEKTNPGRPGAKNWQPPKPGNLRESKKIKLKYVKR